MQGLILEGLKRRPEDGVSSVDTSLRCFGPFLKDPLSLDRPGALLDSLLSEVFPDSATIPRFRGNSVVLATVEDTLKSLEAVKYHTGSKRSPEAEGSTFPRLKGEGPYECFKTTSAYREVQHGTLDHEIEYERQFEEQKHLYPAHSVRSDEIKGCETQDEYKSGTKH